jgi:hypothetical protein
MSNDLQSLQNAVAPQQGDAQELAKAGLLGGTFFGALRVASSGKLVNAGVKPGNFAYVHGDNTIDLGPEVTFVPLAYRPKAVDYNEGVSSYNMESELFKDIHSRSGQSDSGCGVGPEFLVWLPERQEFVLYHANGASARRSAGFLLEHFFKVVGGKTQHVKKGRQEWFAAQWFESDVETPAPTEADTRDALDTFNRQVESETVVEASDNETGGRDV